MRTRVVIEAELLDRDRALTGIQTNREIIHEALRLLIQLRQQGEVRKLRGKLRWEGDLESMRLGRFSQEGE